MKNVILYWIPDAEASMLAKSHLDEKKIQYTTVDVSKPENARKLAQETKQWNAPVLAVDNEAIVGYEPGIYDKLLEKE